MSKPFSYLFPILMLLLAACSNPPPQTAQVPEESAGPEEIIFGRFCGMCPRNCAPMYGVNYTSRQLFLDTTDSYLKGEGNVILPTQPEPPARYELAREVASFIPPSLQAVGDSTFGCPDCADGCGIYFEIKERGKTRKWRLDYQTESLEGEAKMFADKVKALITRLEGTGR